MTKPLSIFNAQKSTSSQILFCALERSINIRNPTKLGRKGLNGSSMRKATETVTESMESRLEFEWNIFPGFTTLQLCGKVTDLLSNLGETTRNFHRKNSIYVDVQTTFLVTRKTMKKNVWQMPKSSPYLQRSLVLDNGHLLVQVPRRSGIPMEENSPQGISDHIAEKMLLEFAESGCPIFRATTPLSRG